MHALKAPCVYIWMNKTCHPNGSIPPCKLCSLPSPSWFPVVPFPPAHKSDRYLDNEHSALGGFRDLVVDVEKLEYKVGNECPVDEDHINNVYKWNNNEFKAKTSQHQMQTYEDNLLQASYWERRHLDMNIYSKYKKWFFYCSLMVYTSILLSSNCYITACFQFYFTSTLIYNLNVNRVYKMLNISTVKCPTALSAT